MARKGIVIDLKRCVGCCACVMACKATHTTAKGVFWARVLERETGKYPSPKRTFLPVLCNHCAEPLCEQACPTGATSKREDGIVLVDYDKCIGCRACVEACPYEVRFFLRAKRGYFPSGLTALEERGYQKIPVGVVQKCTLCAERVDSGLEPACVQTCPAEARHFGDLDDPYSEVSRLLRSRNPTQLRAELGTDPSVYYLP